MVELPDGAVETLLAEDPGGPVVMLNLLRFRPEGGRETYQRYVDAVGAVSARYGVEIVYLGEGGRALAAEDGQAWDTVLLVRYPSREHFAAMIRDPAYREIEHLRVEGLAEAVLQPTVPAIGREVA
ncbi:DUF1330 domain-containing protein [Actinomycetospora straminea]|uniref:DUF1330 domain-containing protein n=1 Tax=Actinomycetospora straminea TaxID=663607 RepID=A0ABP9F7M1_9PSEU|nr:DUF1330 domain-containing protein [Actinomycetospora straminea]MDD7936352.1 DUF1330 domain-containing protein [Actinomycetospora straminea]